MREPVEVASIVSRAWESSSRVLTNSTSQVLPVASPTETRRLDPRHAGHAARDEGRRRPAADGADHALAEAARFVSKTTWVPSGAAWPSWNTWALNVDLAPPVGHLGGGKRREPDRVGASGGEGGGGQERGDEGGAVRTHGV